MTLQVKFKSHFIRLDPSTLIITPLKIQLPVDLLKILFKLVFMSRPGKKEIKENGHLTAVTENIQHYVKQRMDCFHLPSKDESI